MHPVSPNVGREVAAFTFFSLLVILFNSIAKMSMAVGTSGGILHQCLFGFDVSLFNVRPAAVWCLLWCSIFDIGLCIVAFDSRIRNVFMLCCIQSGHRCTKLADIFACCTG